MSKDRDSAFEMAASSVRYGAGVTRELGADLAERGHHRVMVVTDRVVATLPPVAAVLETLEHHNIHVVLYDYVRVEPTDASLRDAIDVAQRESCDAFVAVGGGSTIDSSAIDLSGTDITKPYDYNKLIRETELGEKAFDPRYGREDLWNAGLQGQFSVKFIF